MADERWSVPSYLGQGEANGISKEIASLPVATAAAKADRPAPGGEPAVPEAPATQTQEPDRPSRQEYADMPMMDVAGRALSNAPRSALNTIKGIGEAVYNYEDTASTLNQLGKGLYSKAKGALGFERNPEAEAMADAVGSMYADRYGSMAGFKEALAEDPFSVGLDVASVAPVIGVAGKAAGLGKLASGVEKVAALGDPINLAAKGAGLGAKAVLAPAKGVARYAQGMARGVQQSVVKIADGPGRGLKTQRAHGVLAEVR